MIERYVRDVFRRVERVAATTGRPFRDSATGQRFRRIYHLHIRKSAGTSLNVAFWKLCENTEAEGLRGRGYMLGPCRLPGLPGKLVFARHDGRLLQEGTYHVGYSHQPAWALDLPDDTFTVTIVRDPVRRLQSYYRYLLWVRREYGRAPDALRHAEPSWQDLLVEAEALGPIGSESLRHVLDRASAQHVMSQLWMFSEALDPAEAVERLRTCSAVLRTEHFAEDLAALGSRLGLPLHRFYERGYDYAGLPEPDGADLRAAREALEPEYVMLDRLSVAQVR